MSTPPPPNQPPNHPQWRQPQPQSGSNPPQGPPWYRAPGQPPYGAPGQPPYGQHPGATTFAPQPPQKKKRGVGFWVLIGVLAIMALIFVSCTAALVGGAGNGTAAPAASSTVASAPATQQATEEPSEQVSDEPTEDADDEPSSEASEEPTEEPTEEPEPTKKALSSGQENAVESAEQYLDYQAFSKKGLIKQLKFEGYSEKDASFAASYINADWKDQAVKSGKQYLDYTSFSQSGLVKQLEFEGFTHDQAVYGAKKAFK